MSIDDLQPPMWNRQSSIVNRQLEERREAGLYRALRVLPPDVLDLASNDYLGLARHPEVLQATCEAVKEFGAGARASRLVSGHCEIHEQLESALARFKKCEAALVFPSGYHANLAVITALARSHDLICCDKRNHASLIDACLLAQARGATVRYYDSPSKLRGLLEKGMVCHAPTNSLIVSDAVYSMDGDLAPLPELLQLATEFDATLILDDAHGTGTLGAHGRGALEYFKDQNSKINRPLASVHQSKELSLRGSLSDRGNLAFARERLPRLVPRLAMTYFCKRSNDSSTLVQIGTLSKALGSQGGFVCGSKVLIEWLVNAARPFIYTTGLNPAACGAALQSLKIIEREPQRLRRLQDVKTKLAHGLSTLGFDAREQPSPIIPVIVGEAARAVELSEKLLQRGLWCPAIRPPTVPQNSSRLRVTANAELSDADVARVLQAFSEIP
jgi:7-keto-8-aminopelargonate synthetase-like enzyme